MVSSTAFESNCWSGVSVCTTCRQPTLNQGEFSYPMGICHQNEPHINNSAWLTESHKAPAASSKTTWCLRVPSLSLPIMRGRFLCPLGLSSICHWNTATACRRKVSSEKFVECPFTAQTHKFHRVSLAKLKGQDELLQRFFLMLLSIMKEQEQEEESIKSIKG